MTVDRHTLGARLRELREQAQAVERGVLEAARDQGATWEELGQALGGRSAQAVQQHYRRIGGGRSWPTRRKATEQEAAGVGIEPSLIISSHWNSTTRTPEHLRTALLAAAELARWADETTEDTPLTINGISQAADLVGAIGMLTARLPRITDRIAARASTLTSEAAGDPDVLAQALTALRAVAEHVRAAEEELNLAGRALNHLARPPGRETHRPDSPA